MLRFATLLFIPALLSARTTVSFDKNWQFSQAAPSGPFPTVSIPHDWAILGQFSEANPTGPAGAFLPSGRAYYRKTFTLPPQEAVNRFFIEFDGVMANSEVSINGFALGKRPNGYVSFSYELTGHLNFGLAKPNLLEVKTDTSQQPASRWYEGNGIYREVRLVKKNPVHIVQYGTFVSSSANNTVHLETTVTNQSSVRQSIFIEASLTDPQGKPLPPVSTPALDLAPGATTVFRQDIAVAAPALWNPETPNLYRATASIKTSNATLDAETVEFGIRDAHFEAATGFWINGRNIKLKGVCLHPEMSALGIAVPLTAYERRLNELKALGVNAIRLAHNPFSPAFLALCDRMGMLVMNEMFDQWTVAKNPFDYHLNFNEWSKIDTRDTVQRDRNHPSIIAYSAGNEIHDTPKADLAKEILAGLIKTFHENDPTRPVTQALFRPNVSHDYDNGLADLLDVVGQNYRENEIIAAHVQKPSRKIVGTENGHERRNWLALRDTPAYAGQFLWVGVDYLGEGRRWPVVGTSSGLLDRTGLAKPLAYERQSWWSETPMVHITRRVAPRQRTPVDPGYEAGDRYPVLTAYDDWTPAITSPHEENVEVYSNCDDVELFLNEKSLGSKSLPADAAPRVWRVPYESGTLRAVAKNKGREAAVDQLKTAGKAARILLTTDHPQLTTDWNQVAYVRATVVDAAGVRIPNAADIISFSVSGPGTLAAVDNGDNIDHESFQTGQRHAYLGTCVAIVRGNAAGTLRLKAAAAGLTPAEFPLSVR